MQKNSTTSGKNFVRASAFALLLLTGCASTQFEVVGQDEYQIYRWSDACAAGSPTAVLEGLRAEALRFCAARKEVPVEVAADTQYGIPVVRCADATLRFRCQPK